MATSDKRSKMLLPWLVPVGLVAVVPAVAFVPNWLVGILGLVALALIGWVGVPLYWRLRQDRGDGSGVSQ